MGVPAAVLFVFCEEGAVAASMATKVDDGGRCEFGEDLVVCCGECVAFRCVMEASLFCALISVGARCTNFDAGVLTLVWDFWVSAVRRGLEFGCM